MNLDELEFVGNTNIGKERGLLLCQVKVPFGWKEIV